jgi:hypothetical protein
MYRTGTASRASQKRRASDGECGQTSSPPAFGLPVLLEKATNFADVILPGYVDFETIR